MGRRVKPAKGQAEAKRPLARKSPKTDAPRVRDLGRRLEEALEQQTATSEILRVISNSPTDLAPILETIVRRAILVCQAEDAGVFLVDGEDLRVSAHSGPIAVIGGAARIRLNRATPLGKAVIEGEIIHVDDLTTAEEFPEGRALAAQLGFRTTLCVPLLREHAAIGAIGIRRVEVRPFTDKQIALLKTFADQAVIAIENVRLFTELQVRNRDLSQALDQQTATSEILRVISSSPTDIQPVFDTIAVSAVRLCEGQFCHLFQFDGKLLHFVAHHGLTPEGVEAVRRGYPMRPGQGSTAARSVLSGAVEQIPDVHADPDYRHGAIAKVVTSRSNLAVPMLRDGVPIGALVVARSQAGLFPDRQIALLQTFADQAVIAIENVRLFKELQEKNRALTEAHAQVSEALEQQTATSEILRVIAGSPNDIQPVFDTIMQSAAALCNARNGVVLHFDGEKLHFVASTGWTNVDDVRGLYPRQPDPETLAGRVILEGGVVHIDDFETDPHISEVVRGATLAQGARSALGVPMVQRGKIVGAITLGKPLPEPFTTKQIALLQTFADQAVIAIDNVRLFTELQTSNRELTTALDTQTATSDILRVISRSQTDVQPVFDAIVRNAVQLCDAVFGRVFRRDGEMILLAANANFPDELGHHPAPLNQDTLAGRVMVSGHLHLSVDVETDPAIPVLARETYRHRGVRSILSVPMLRDGQAIGAIAVGHRDEGAFADTHVALLQTFADQAVIAIENARLLSELQARTRELTQSVDTLTALGEVGQAISSTLDLQTVLRTIVARATQLADADAGVIYEYDAQREVFEPRATERLEDDIVRTLVATPVRKGQGATGRLAEVREPIQLADLRALGEQIPVRDSLINAGYRALLAVPLVREDHLIGGLTVFRKTPGAFAADTVDLLKTFATQSSLAIQNARLFREIAQKSRELEVASQHKSEFLASMSHELRTPLNAIIGFSDVLLQGMFGETNEKQTEYLRDILASGQHLLSLINDILDLSKIEAGRMELDVAAFDLPTAIDDALLLMRERAGRRGITLERHVDERLGEIRADQRKVKQVLLNLLSNAVKFTPEGGRIDVRAGLANGTAEISVTDTGIGIAPEDHDAVFEEFRQVGAADKKAEGTGLGLALCRKFVELHGGRIRVQSQVGQGSTFTLTLPLSR